jgi:hypothetical protein
MPNLWILACKELNGNIYLAQLPQAIDDQTPGIPTGFPNEWNLVGPGTNPSIQEYNGTQFILTFNYLSHLFCRIVDIGTWPPTVVNPVQTSGGPNPPTAIQYNIQLSTDALTLKTESSVMLPNFAVSEFYNPPILEFPLLFLDATTDTYSVTLQPAAGYAPNVQQPFFVGPAMATTTPYYRLYVRPFPYTGPWILAQDWTITNPTFPWFTFVFSNVGSLRYQFSVVWGNQFSFAAPWNPTQHEGGIPGQTFITIDSTLIHPSFQATIHEVLTLERMGNNMFGIFSPPQRFFDESPTDQIQLSRSLLGNGSGNMFAFFDVRQAFFNEEATDSIPAYSASEASKGGNMFGAFYM